MYIKLPEQKKNQTIFFLSDQKICVKQSVFYFTPVNSR